MSTLDSFKHRWLIGHIPPYFLPFYFVYNVVGFTFWLFYFCLLKATCKFFVEDLHAQKREGGCIFAVWHESSWPYFAATFPFRKHVWISHPFWYMKPIILFLNVAGVKFILGSSGHGGRQAAEKVTAFLREGWKSALTPDGPNGPPRQVKKGILHMAMASRCPVVPISIKVSRCVRTNAWDRKIYPLPFAKISLSFGEPIFVTQENFATVSEEIAKQLSR